MRSCTLKRPPIVGQGRSSISKLFISVPSQTSSSQTVGFGFDFDLNNLSRSFIKLESKEVFVFVPGYFLSESIAIAQFRVAVGGLLIGISNEVGWGTP